MRPPQCCNGGKSEWLVLQQECMQWVCWNGKLWASRFRTLADTKIKLWRLCE